MGAGIAKNADGYTTGSGQIATPRIGETTGSKERIPVGKTNIGWCDFTLNPWIGCSKISPGCANCYAATQDRFRKWTPEGWGGPRRRTSAANWKQPLKWDREVESQIAARCRDGETAIDDGPIHRPRVFCASLADWLDDEVPIEWLADLLKLIHDTPNLDWQLLTKRPENWRPRLNDLVPLLMDNKPDVGNWVCDWLGIPSVFQPHPPSNVWIGTTCENQEYADKRIPELLKIPAKVRFLSCEPLLGPVDLRKAEIAASDVIDEEWRDNRRGAPLVNILGDDDEEGGIHWIITGCESGPKRRLSKLEWFTGLRDQCRAAGVPFFMKQLEVNGKVSTKLSTFPPELKVQEFPQ